MDQWAKMMKKLMRQNLVVTYLFQKYVDDCNINAENMKRGSRWINSNTEEKGAIEWKKDWEEEDRMEQRSNEKVTMNVLVNMANSIATDLKFTGDLPEDHRDGKCPMLDFCTWVEERTDENGIKKQEVHHQFYQKPMASQLVMMSQS